MRRPRIFVNELAAGDREVFGREAHHLVYVLRAKPGMLVRAFDGRGHEADGEIVAAGEHSVTLSLAAPKDVDVEPPFTLTLGVALLKGDKLSGVMRMCTELGVSVFQPVVAGRATVRNASAAKMARWRRIVVEAAKQSGRSVVPDVRDALALDSLEPGDLGLVADPAGSASVGEAVRASRLGAPRHLTLLCGPEGGFAEGELERLVAKGFRAVSLGPRVLRAETAPIAFAAAVLVPEAL